MQCNPSVQITLKLNGQDCAGFSYILFPLRTGQLRAPKLIIETAPNGTTVLEPVLLKVRQDASDTIFVTVIRETLFIHIISKLK
jgi:hypothetical protein